MQTGEDIQGKMLHVFRSANIVLTLTVRDGPYVFDIAPAPSLTRFSPMSWVGSLGVQSSKDRRPGACEPFHNGF